MNTPGSTHTHRRAWAGRAWDADVEINAGGYRGPMGSPGKFDGFRAIAIGDSITFGNMLPVESTYPFQLQEFREDSFTGVEVLNFGVGGYDILQAVSLLEASGSVYRPDLVVVGFCLNDIGVASPNLEYILRSGEYQSGPWFRLRIIRFIGDRIDRIRIGNWMDRKNQPEVFRKDYASRIAAIGKDEKTLRELMLAAPESYPSAGYGDEDRIGRLRYSFDRLSPLASKGRFSVVVVIFPWLDDEEMDCPYEIPHKIVTLEARRAGFDVIDVTRDFRGIGMARLRIAKDDWVHPNSAGHKVVADRLARYILEKWLAGAPEKDAR